MKLHLPLPLRAALLGCFTAAALIPPAAANDLTWDPSHETWAEGSPFSTNASFQTGDNVTFGPLNDATETVNLQGSLEVGEMTVNAGAGKTYTFAGEGSITSLAGLTVTSGTAEFTQSQILPEGAQVDIDGGGKLQLGTGDDLCNCNLNLTLGGTGHGAAELEFAGSNDMTVLNGSLTMKDGSILRMRSTGYYPWLEMKGDLTVEGTVTVDMAANMAALNISGSYRGDGTIRITGESTWSMISLWAPGNYNLILDCIDAEVSLNSGTYANIVIPEHRAGGLNFAHSRASADVHVDGEFYVTAVSNDVILKSLTGSGTALVSQGTLMVEDGDFSGSMQVGESWQFSDATLVLGSADAMAHAESLALTGGGSCLASLALAEGVGSATLKKLAALEYSRLQTGSYRVKEGGSFAGTLENGVTLTIGAAGTMNMAGARVAESGAASIVGESGSTIQNLTLGAGMTLGASLAAGEAAVTLQHLTLAAGGTITIAMNGSLTAGYTPICSYTAGNSITSNLAAGETIQLTLALKDGGSLSLDAGTSYVLISNVGSTADAAWFSLQDTGDDASAYELLVENGDLVLVAPGSLTTALIWDPSHETWAVGSPFSADDTPFQQGDSVTFGPLTDASEETVSIQGSLEVGTMTVDAGADKTYIFTGSGSMTSLSSLRITSGTAEFGQPAILPEGARVGVAADGKLKLDSSRTAYNLNVTLEKDGQLELGGENGTTTLDGSLTMREGSVLRLKDTGEYSTYSLKGTLNVESTVTVEMENQSSLSVDGSYQGEGTLRLTSDGNAAGSISLNAPGTYNLQLERAQTNIYLSAGTHARITLPENNRADLMFSNSQASAAVCADGRLYVNALAANGTISSLTGSGTAMFTDGEVMLEAGDFAGTVRVGTDEWWYYTSTLVLGSADVLSRAAVELVERETDVASLALAEGVSSAHLRSLTGAKMSRLQAGSYRVKEGGSFAGTLENGVTLTIGAAGTMNMAGARVAESGAASIVGESGSTIQNLTLGAGMTLGASLAAGEAAVNLDHVTLADGGTIRIALAESSAAGYTPLCSYAAGESLTSSLSAGQTVLLALGDGALVAPEAGESYVLISDIGAEVNAGCFRLNYTNEGSTQYELRVEDGDLVLAVRGASAAVLHWDGGAEGNWNTAQDNRIWESGDNPSSFNTYDRVVFGTQTGVPAAVVHVDAAGVTSGSITVVGSTDYEISGGPISTAEQSGAGLTVGTQAEAFSGTLTLSSANSWDGDTVINSGTVVVTDALALSDTTASVKNGATLRLGLGQGETLAAAVQLDGGTVAADAAGAAVAALSVSEKGGTLDGTAGALEASITSAAAEASLNAAGTVSLNAAGGGSLKLGTLNLLAGQATSVTAGSLEIGTLLSDGAESSLQASELTLTGSGTRMAGSVQADVLTLSGSTTQEARIAHLRTDTLRYTFLQTGAAPLTLGSYSSSAAADGTISIDLTTRALAAGDGSYTLLSLSETGTAELDAADFTLSSDTLTQLGEGGAAEFVVSGQSLLVTLSGIVPEAHYYENLVGSAASVNGRAGLRLADQALVAQSVRPGGDLDRLLTALDEVIAAGNPGASDGIAAELSGASATTLGLAFAADAQRHLNSIRNRLATMKVDTIGAPAADPVTGPVPAKSNPVSAWVNAEGSYQTMEQSGSAPGYSMSSWGGTLGVEVSPLKNLSCGLALTALYGDLDADARDAASGDLDTCYISAFGQYRHSAWTHTLVASLGLSDISLDRTVSHSQGSYRTSGDTTGTSLGFLYELSYDIPLNGGATTIIQPLVNLSYLHTSVGGYTETGSDAALRYGDQSMDSVSLGLGGRVQSLAGESVFNRSALIEGRVLAKFNCGDRRSAASVGFANGIGLSGVESAEVGVFGVELGAGLTVPLGGEAGSIFVDASYELYREYSNLNASVGYRLSF